MNSVTLQYIVYIVDDVCPRHAFLCANNQCIPETNVCDGIVQCEDNSDETEICTGDDIIPADYSENNYKNIFYDVPHLNCQGDAHLHSSSNICLNFAQDSVLGIVFIVPMEIEYHNF